MYAFKYTFTHTHIDFKKKEPKRAREKSVYVNGRAKAEILCEYSISRLRDITNICLIPPYMYTYMLTFQTSANLCKQDSVDCYW